MIKNILIIILGGLIGSILAGGAFLYFYSTKVEVQGSSKDIKNLNISGGLTPVSNIASSELGTLLSKAQLTPEYKKYLQLIADTVVKIAKSNTDIINPNLESLRQKSLAGDWNGIFDVVATIKTAIKDDRKLLPVLQSNIANLTLENESLMDTDPALKASTDQYIKSSSALMSSFVAYFATLDKVLVGKFPSKELVEELNQRVENLNKSYTNYKNILSSVKI